LHKCPHGLSASGPLAGSLDFAFVGAVEIRDYDYEAFPSSFNDYRAYFPASKIVLMWAYIDGPI